MSANYHTPIGVGAALDSLALNTIFGALDQGITDMDTRVDALESMRIGTEDLTLLNLGDQSTKTLASNAFTRSASFHYLETEGAAAADYLDTISGGNDGDIIVIAPASPGREITLRHGIGNCYTRQSANYTIPYQRPIMGIRDNNGWTFVCEAGGNKAIVQHQEASGVDGGTFTNGAWQTRDINALVSDVNHIVSYQKLAFTSGGTYEITASDIIVGASSGAIAIVFDVELTSGSWAAGDAAGNLWLYNQTGNFAAENLNVGAEVNVATVAADSTTGEMRLGAGTYHVSGWAIARYVSNHQTRLQDTTNTATLITGESSYAAASTIATNSNLEGIFTLTDYTTIELQHQCSVTRATDGFGDAASFTTEVYASLTIRQEI